MDNDQQDFSPKIANTLSSYLETQLDAEIDKCVPFAIVKDCKPSDELPVVGLAVPYSSGIFLATGYSGSGAGLGYSAGKAIADYIIKGQTNILHPKTKPERFWIGEC